MHANGLNGSHEEVASDHDFTCFPAPRPNVHPISDTEVKHHFSHSLNHGSSARATALIYVSWALVVSHQTGSTRVLFDTTTIEVDDQSNQRDSLKTEPFRFHVDLSCNHTISHLLDVNERQVHVAKATSREQLCNTNGDGQASSSQTLLVLRRDGMQSQDRLGQLRDDSNNSWRSRYSLVLAIGIDANGVTITTYFDSRVLNSWTVQKLLERLEKVMDLVGQGGAGSGIRDLEVLTAGDLEDIWTWNRTVPQAIDRCAHELIEERAITRPDLLAVCAWDGQLTYGELKALADRLAIQLRHRGVGPDVLVPLCFEKSMWTTVALLGVLKAGGGFVFIEPSLPERRLKTIVDQVGSGIILSSVTNHPLAARLCEAVIQVGPGLEQSLGHSSALNGHTEPQSPASTMYAVFTSGSTGTPKGAIISHSNFCSASFHQLEILGFKEETRVADLASYSFDTAVHNTCATLVSGGCICVPSNADKVNDLNGALAATAPNLVNTTSTVARLLDPAAAPSLRTTILIGETVTISDARQWWGKTQLITAYGPAECTTLGTINHDASSPERATCIGSGVGLVTWIVDPNDHHRLLPPGCVGELLLEGPLVGQGYLKEPEKTAAAFVTDPPWLLRGSPGCPGRHGRLYKTGDLARYNEDGSLMFMGRNDSQVKIRGQRVELGEVEQCVQRCFPEAVLVAAEVVNLRGGKGASILVAFLQQKCLDSKVFSHDQDIAHVLSVDAAIEDKLLEYLPRYMVPTAFLTMQQLPRIPTGKIDRKRLRHIAGSFTAQQLLHPGRAGADSTRPPTSQMECQLQALWARVLGIDENDIGLDDDFFKLGGNSVTVMQLVGEARNVDIELSATDLFRSPSLASVAKQARFKKDEPCPDVNTQSIVDPMVEAALLKDINNLNDRTLSGNIAEVLPLTSFQQMWLANAMEHRDYLYDYYTADVGPEVDISRLSRSCAQALEKLPILRACYPFLHGRYWQVIRRNLDSPLRVIDAQDGLDTALHSIRRVELETAVASDPPVAFLLLRHHSEGVRFVIRLSHCQYDGYCLPKIIQCLVSCYRDEPFASPPDMFTFLSYAMRRRPKSLQYWQKLLRGSTLSKIPAPDNLSGRNTRVEAEVARPHLPANITLASFLSCAWALLIRNMTGANDVVFGHLVSGRNSAFKGAHEVVGPCINIIPVRLRLAACPNVADLLLSMQEQFIALEESDSLGFDEIIKHCTDWPAGTRFDSVVNHQNIDLHPSFPITGADSKFNMIDVPDFVVPCLWNDDDLGDKVIGRVLQSDCKVERMRYGSISARITGSRRHIEV
ncbi:hypothetical protein HIM_05263 [Hirsutella minnesotensis 3608]|uniref:Carrier domain-containing protein n=1 Tax=Hirsutella minnesotensis 3608 TaxID=1043627 RepID=A0A0F8A0H5_9HYPO|nr:hypothetical protein HIM_05263 [Hirsutella minnesotensis 3608]